MQRCILYLLVSFLVPGLAGAQSSVTDNLFHPDSLRSIINVLASDSLQGRLTGSVGCYKASLYVANQFKRAGLKTVAGNNGFFMPVKGNWGNVVGVLMGKSRPGELIIFSAHYDHIGTFNTQPFGGMQKDEYLGKKDTIYNGANDDASGVSAVISLARYYGEMKQNERTLVFVAFAGEELGMVGSGFFASACEPDSIIADINIEMIGRKYYSGGHPFITGVGYSNLPDLLNQRLFEADQKTYKKPFIFDDPFGSEGLFERSDNFPLAQKGIPAHTIMVTSPQDEFYHSLNDESRTLNYKLMSDIIRAIAIACEGLVNGSDTPTRIKTTR